MIKKCIVINILFISLFIYSVKSMGNDHSLPQVTSLLGLLKKKLTRLLTEVMHLSHPQTYLHEEIKIQEDKLITFEERIEQALKEFFEIITTDPQAEIIKQLEALKNKKDDYLKIAQNLLKEAQTLFQEAQKLKLIKANPLLTIKLETIADIQSVVEQIDQQAQQILLKLRQPLDTKTSNLKKRIETLRGNISSQSKETLNQTETPLFDIIKTCIDQTIKILENYTKNCDEDTKTELEKNIKILTTYLKWKKPYYEIAEELFQKIENYISLLKLKISNNLQQIIKIGESGKAFKENIINNIKNLDQIELCLTMLANKITVLNKEILNKFKVPGVFFNQNLNALIVKLITLDNSAEDKFKETLATIFQFATKYEVKSIPKSKDTISLLIELLLS